MTDIEILEMNEHIINIYDGKQEKWIMLDPTTNCYMINHNKKPLSLLEMREAYANNENIVPIIGNTLNIEFDELYK